MSLISGSYSLPPPTTAPARPVEALREGIVENAAPAGSLCLEIADREANKDACSKFF